MVDQAQVRWLARHRLLDPLLTLWSVPWRVLRPFQLSAWRRTPGPRRLQIGCGLQLLEGWLNMDYVPRRKGAVFLNATRRFPFAEETFDLIFSEHVIEHFDYAAGEAMLRECYRVLRPGGRIRIATPNLAFLVDLYRDDKSDLQRRYLDWAVIYCGLPTDTPHRDTVVINNFVRDWGHRFIYDVQTLSALMEDIGFIGCTACEVGESDVPELAGLEHHGDVIPDDFNRLESFVLEAGKG